MTTQCIENNFNQSTGQQNNHRSTNKHIYRLLWLTPILFVLAGAVLTVVGNTVSLNNCKIAGPLLPTLGGLFLLFFCWRVRFVKQLVTFAQQTHFYKTWLRSFASVDSPSIFLTVNPWDHAEWCAPKSFQNQGSLPHALSLKRRQWPPDTNNSLSEDSKTLKIIFRLENLAWLDEHS